MRILVASINAWDDTNSLGNTVSNFFGDWEDAQFMNLYFRESAPGNNICKKYFRVSDKMMLKALLSAKSCGKYFEIDSIEKKRVTSAKREKKLVSLLHRYNLSFARSALDSLWEKRKWQNENFRNAVKDFNPDIVFMFAKADAQYYYSAKYIKEHTNAKIVLFAADDVYSVYKSGKDAYSQKLVKRFHSLMEMADKVYAISPAMCKYYGDVFGKEFDLLQKGCEGFSPVNAGDSSCVKMVYAGNLLYGRYEILCRISEAIKNAAEKFPVSFEIYSGDILSEGELKGLENSFTKFMGRRPYNEIEKIIAKCDVVLHAESFEPDKIQEVKFSFSTKITDCLKSGSVLLVVGPSGIASVDYAKEVPGVCVIDDINMIEQGIAELLAKKEGLHDMAVDTQAYAVKNHHIDFVRNRIHKDFEGLLEKW